jgi:hypothetical protein
MGQPTMTTTTVHCSPSDIPLSIGLRFIRFEGESEQVIAELVTHYLAEVQRSEECREQATLISDILNTHERRSLFGS